MSGEKAEFDYPLTAEARVAFEAELTRLSSREITERQAYWSRYRELGEEIFFKGLTKERLHALGGELREGISFRDVGEAVLRGRGNGIGAIERELACIRDELQKVITFSTERSL